MLSAINVILMTALATIAAYLYNLAAQLLGGIEVTFAEDDETNPSRLGLGNGGAVKFIAVAGV